MITIPQPQTTITPLCERPAWKALQQHHAKIQNVHLRQLFAEDPQRGQHFALEALAFYFDYSKNRITNGTIRLLLELAEQSRLREHVNAMFGGEKINVTEKRAVLHVALRAAVDDSIMVDGVNVVPRCRLCSTE
jgi:glucose-6-phosphate isomerase